jgi:hypothetical protein
VERFILRSTSIIGLQAELHQRDLLEEAERAHDGLRRIARRRRTFLGLPLPGGRPHR